MAVNNRIIKNDNATPQSFKTPENQGDNFSVDIVDASPGTDGGSSHHYTSPFVPNVQSRRRSIGPTRDRAAASTTPNEQTAVQESTPTSEDKERQDLQERRDAPEKELILFAMRLAVLEKLATTVGTLGFIWATVVILGGYAAIVKTIDFWFVTVILVTEGARIFSRSHELEWQHQDVTTNTISLAYRKGSDAIRSALSNLVSPSGESRPPHLSASDQLESPHLDDYPVTQNNGHAVLTKSRSISRVSLVPFMSWISQAKHVSRFLYSMQLVSAVLSIVLSVLRLSSRDFRTPAEGDTATNHASALIVFYFLTVLEALVFLLERFYWQYQISVNKILVKVNDDFCKLPNNDRYATRCFFYDVYSKCLTGSIFEGLKMDLLDYAISWLQSDAASEQSGGLCVLLTFSDQPEFREDTLRAISTRQGTVERLLEMITWKNPEEQKIREDAARLLRNLVRRNRHSVRVAAISGSIDAIFSLLFHDDLETDGTELPFAQEYVRAGSGGQIAEKHLATYDVGLRILINLARNTVNCAKIGSTRGVLATLISMIDVEKNPLLWSARKTEDTILYLSLELLNLLARCPGLAGKNLREDISKVLFSITNLRNVLNLKHAGSHDVLQFQELAAGTLSSLAMNDEVREVIGRTGGIMRSLYAVFLKEMEDGGEKPQMSVAVRAGEALTLLALQDKNNCDRMLGLKLEKEGCASCEGTRDVVEALLGMLGDMKRGHLAISILRSLCSYTDDQGCKTKVAKCTWKVMKVVMEEKGRRQEAALGLTARIVPHLTREQLEEHRRAANIASKAEIVKRIGGVLELHPTPSTTLPRVRRHCLELIVALLTVDAASFLPEFQGQNFAVLLDRVAATASDLENYSTFSGAVGVTLHGVTMEKLLTSAIQELQLHHEISFS